MNCARSLLVAGLFIASLVRGGAPEAPAFSYQGQLKQDGVPYAGAADFAVGLFDTPDVGQPPLAFLLFSNIDVVHGLFSLELSFDPSLLDGSPRWLGISVRAPHDPTNTGEFTGLSDRQPIHAAPYAIHALNAPSGDVSNWEDAANNVNLPFGNVGVGTDQPQAMLHLNRPLGETAIRFQTVRFAEGPPVSAARIPGGATTGGVGQVWNSPDAARVADDVRATTNLSEILGSPDNDLSQSLNLTNLGFSIPVQALVVGIQVSIEASGNCFCVDCDRCSAVIHTELLGGTGASQVVGVAPPATEGTLAAGGAFDPWGLEWTAAQINDPAFGVRLVGDMTLSDIFFCIPGFPCTYIQCDCTGDATVRVDAVSVSVFFYDVSVTSTPVDWTMGIPELSSSLHISPRADLVSPTLIISPLGSVGIGTNEFLNGFFKLAVNGPAAKPSGGSWSALSDARLKRNIEPLSGALGQLLRLRGVTFEFTEEGIATGLARAGRHTGFVAQEVEPVFPEWVGEGGGFKFVTEEGTTALLVEALRELRAEKDAQIEILTRRIERLESNRVSDPKSP